MTDSIWLYITSFSWSWLRMRTHRVDLNLQRGQCSHWLQLLGRKFLVAVFWLLKLFSGRWTHKLNRHFVWTDDATNHSEQTATAYTHIHTHTTFFFRGYLKLKPPQALLFYQTGSFYANLHLYEPGRHLYEPGSPVGWHGCLVSSVQQESRAVFKLS